MLDLLDPTPHQALVINELLTGDKRAVCWLGATGSGKTAGLCESIALMSQRDTELGIGSGDSILLGPDCGPAQAEPRWLPAKTYARTSGPVSTFHSRATMMAALLPDSRPEVASIQWWQGWRRRSGAGVGRNCTYWNDETQSNVREDAFQAATLRMRYPEGQAHHFHQRGQPLPLDQADLH